MPHPYNQIPETMACGCCAHGCVCKEHQDGIAGIFTCLYHALKPATPETINTRQSTPTTSQNRVTAALQTARALLHDAAEMQNQISDMRGPDAGPCHYAACVAEIDAILQTTVAPEPLSDRAALQSILAWTEKMNSPGMPYDAKARCTEYAGLMCNIRNAARAALNKV